MSIPAKAYAENWVVFWVNLPILLLAPVVVYLLLPVFNRLQSASAYEYLESRFGLSARLYGATAFVLFQVGRMALVIYLPALALAAVTDVNIIVCILLIGVLSAVYSALGGIEGVIWTDFAQTVFLIGAAVNGRSASEYVGDVTNTPRGAIVCGGLSVLVVAATYALAIVMTAIILKVVDALVGLRVSDEDEVAGLDLSQHSETAYTLGGGSYSEMSGGTGAFAEAMRSAEAKGRTAH
jgi:hypothetical protein